MTCVNESFGAEKAIKFSEIAQALGPVKARLQSAPSNILPVGRQKEMAIMPSDLALGIWARGHDLSERGADGPDLPDAKQEAELDNMALNGFWTSMELRTSGVSSVGVFSNTEMIVLQQFQRKGLSRRDHPDGMQSDMALVPRRYVEELQTLRSQTDGEDQIADIRKAGQDMLNRLLPRVPYDRAQAAGPDNTAPTRGPKSYKDILRQAYPSACQTQSPKGHVSIAVRGASSVARFDPDGFVTGNHYEP